MVQEDTIWNNKEFNHK